VLLLPERDSSPESKTDALLEIERLSISHREVDLTPMLKALGIYRLVPLRVLTLYYYADLENLLVLGTTNRSESMTGFVVKWGDNVADIEPIQPLYKVQVRQLSRHVGVSERIIDKAPSPVLIPGIVNTLALGVSYETLDRVLWGIDQGWDTERITAAAGTTGDLVEHVRTMRQRSAHLRTMPPTPELDPRP
jgi:NAD+ synthase